MLLIACFLNLDRYLLVSQQLPMMAEQSMLSMSGFEVLEDSVAVCPSTPGGLSVDEFNEATPLKQRFCQQVSLEQYDNQGMSETEKALNVSCFVSAWSIFNDFSIRISSRTWRRILPF